MLADRWTLGMSGLGGSCQDAAGNSVDCTSSSAIYCSGSDCASMTDSFGNTIAWAGTSASVVGAGHGQGPVQPPSSASIIQQLTNELQSAQAQLSAMFGGTPTTTGFSPSTMNTVVWVGAGVLGLVLLVAIAGGGRR